MWLLNYLLEDIPCDQDRQEKSLMQTDLIRKSYVNSERINRAVFDNLFLVVECVAV